jgi:hypothetical protein
MPIKNYTLYLTKNPVLNPNHVTPIYFNTSWRFWEIKKRRGPRHFLLGLKDIVLAAFLTL